jgi:hypothetical protein
MRQSKRGISREYNDIIGSAKGSQISEKYWGEVGKGKRVDVYLEVRKRRGIYFLNETSACALPPLLTFWSSPAVWLLLFGPHAMIVPPFRSTRKAYIPSTIKSIRKAYHMMSFPFPTSPQYFSLICDPFAHPIISLYSRDIPLFDCLI